MGEASAIKCSAETPNKKNQISLITEPLDQGLAQFVQDKELYRPENKGLLSSHLVKDFAWDDLSADSVWAFGPTSSNANMLLDYTIEGETDKKHLEACRNSIVQGF